MSRVFRTQTLAQQRRHLLQMLAQTVRALFQHPQPDDEARDMVAFLILSLHQIAELVDTTASAWEKRDYWLKADQFRREWDWVLPAAQALAAALAAEDWTAIRESVAERLVPHLAQVTLPKRPRWGKQPWRGAWRTWQERREHSTP